MRDPSAIPDEMHDAGVVPGIVAPVVHSNGTSRDRLLDGYETTWCRIDEALTHLSTTAPNPRDYPDPALFERAVEQHLWRMQRVLDVRDELAVIERAVARQEG